MMRKKIGFLVVMLLAFLSACGGGGSSSTGGGNGAVSVIVMDDLTQTYSEVWVTLYSISAKSDTGADVTLYDNSAGQVINLANLNGIGDLLSVASVTAGTYTKFDVKLDTKVNLVDMNGTTTATTFQSDGTSSTVTFDVNGSLVVTDGAVTSLALDFNLQDFYLNAAGQVVPVITEVTDNDMAHKLKQTVTKMIGDITALTDTGFTMHTTDGMDVTVIVNPNALKMHDDGTSLANLAVGMTVKVIGSYDATSMTITAITVINPAADMAGTSEIKGVITAVSPGMFTLNLKDANFMPSTDTIDVTYDTNTAFANGSADLLAVDQVVEVRGTQTTDSTGAVTFTAQVIEIEGAGENHDGMIPSYADVKGTVTDLTGNTLTVTVSNEYGLDPSIVNTDYAMDITDAYIKGGTLADIVAGVNVDVKGTVDNSTGTPVFHVNIVEIESDTGTTTPNPGMVQSMVSGTVTAIDMTAMTMSITVDTVSPDLASSVTQGQTVTIALTADTVYTNGTPAVNDMVEVKVTSTDTGLVANEVGVENTTATMP